jgi:hypothetical protein
MTRKEPAPVREIKVSAFEEVLPRIQGVTEPLVFRDACRSWPIVQQGLVSDAAAADYLRRLDTGVPGTAFETHPSDRGRIFVNETVTGFNYRSLKLPLRELLDTLLAESQKPEPRGLYMYLELQQLDGFAADNGSGFAELAGLGAVRALLVSNRSCNAAHFDYPQNLPCNLVGERTFTLFPPDQVSNLYPGPLGLSPSGQDMSMVDFRAIDGARFPKAAAAWAAAQQVRLKPGDVLFLPSMWWHHIESHNSFNVLMPQWWRDSPDWLGRPDHALQHAVLALRDLPKAQRQAWKALFNHYVFEHEDHFPEHLPPQVRGPLASPMTEETARGLRAKLVSRLQR